MIHKKQIKHQLPAMNKILIQSKRGGPNLGEFYKQNYKIEKQHDIAILFIPGGPIFDKRWEKISDIYDSLFGKDVITKTKEYALEERYIPHPVTFDVNVDLFYLAQPQWEGLELHKYYTKPLKATGVTGWSYTTAKKWFTLKDIRFLKDFDAKYWKSISSKVIEKQLTWLHESIEQLKKLSYKEIHIIAHSYGGYVLSRYIQKYKEEALLNVNSATMVATRLHFGIDQKKNEPTKKGFPFFVYDNKTNKYTKLKFIKVIKNAATKAILLSTFSHILENTHFDFEEWNSLSAKSKNKIKVFSTEFDSRVGAMTETEIKTLKSLNIEHIIVPASKLSNYHRHYMSANKPGNYLPLSKKPLDKGVNHHDLLLIYLMNNYIEAYGTETFPKKINMHNDCLFKQINTRLSEHAKTIISRE